MNCEARDFVYAQKYAACLLRYCVPIVICAITVLSPGAVAETSPADTLRAFLTSPPSIDEIVYRKRVIAVPKGFPEPNTNAYQFFWARWQGTEFVVRQMQSLEEANDPVVTNKLLLAYGKSGPTFWRIAGDNYIFWEDKESKYSSDFVPLEKLPRNEETLRLVSVFQLSLLQIVSMGIEQLKPHTAKWDGLKFVAQDLYGNSITGELVVDGAVPREIRYRHSGESGYSVVELTYRESDRPSELPRVLVYGYSDANGHRKLYNEFTIDTLRVTSSVIPPGEFFAESLRTPGFTKEIRQVGNNRFYTDQAGNVMRLKKGGERNPQLIRFAMLGVVLIPGLWIMIHFARKRARWQQKQNTKQ